MEGALRPRERLSARGRGAVAAGLLALPRPVVRRLAGQPVTRDGQVLDPSVQLMLRMVTLAGEPDLSSLTVAQARRRLAADVLSVQGPRPEPVSAQPIAIGDGTEPLRGRLYVPAGVEPSAALLVYFHGGGFVLGDLDSHDHLCRALALAGGARVLAVDYRLAPEHPFPAATDDAWAAFCFAAEQATALGADPARIAVGGDSAGGNLAAGVAQRAARQDGPVPALQVLIYPWLDLSRKRDSYRLFGQGFYLSQSDLDWYRHRYIPEAAAAQDPRCSPLLVTDLSGVAPAYIATAGFDPLRDEGNEYAARMRAAGVRTAAHRHTGLIHGFASALGAGRVGREAVMAAAGAMRMGLA